jgi:Phage portal protein, SPP1 Gp6-like
MADGTATETTQANTLAGMVVPVAAGRPYTSEWWLDRLGRELDGRLAEMARLQRYYEGHQPMALATSKYREEFFKIFGRWSDNFMSLVVQALEERLTVEGFSFGSKARNKRASDLWQANELDAGSQKAHREAIIKSECSIIVWPGVNDPLIRVQKPEEVVVAYADDPLVRAVAMKRWKSLDGRTLATLYWPDRLEKYVWLDRDPQGRFNKASWVPREIVGEAWPLPHEFGAVPVVPLVNDPDLDNRGHSEIGDVLPLQDALNKLYMDLLVGSEYGAFRQRWATGIEIPEDPETHKPLEKWKPAIDRLWHTPVPDAKFGDFEQTQLGGIISAIETTIQHIASKTRTPPHYLLGQMGSFPSGESIKSVESGLVAKARRRQRDFGEAWEEVMRLAFRAAGDRIGGAYISAGTSWRNPETQNEAVITDAVVKQYQAGLVTREIAQQRLGYSPQQITEMATPPPIAPAAPAATASSTGG